MCESAGLNRFEEFMKAENFHQSYFLARLAEASGISLLRHHDNKNPKIEHILNVAREAYNICGGDISSGRESICQ